MWAIKLFDDLPGATLMSTLAGTGAEAVELALYSKAGFTSEVESCLKPWPVDRKALHLTHTRISLEGADAPTLEFELAYAAKVGIGPLVTHVSPSNRPATLSPKDAARRSHCLAGACAGFTLCVENSYESLAWWKDYFAARPAGGFTFDLGHSRIWPHGATLPDWVDFLTQLADQGVPLHFHLHINPGDQDRHAPFHVGAANGWLAPSPWAPAGVPPVLERLAALPGLHVLETGLIHASENMAWVNRNLRA